MSTGSGVSRMVAAGSRARGGAVVPTLEAGRDDRHPDLVTEVVVDDGPKDDVGVGVRHGVDDLGRLVHLEEAEVEPPAMLRTMPRAPSMEASSRGT